MASRFLKTIAALSTLSLGLASASLHAAVTKQSYTYDASGRLASVSVAGDKSANEHYVYDASGNITKQTIDGETVTMTYDSANQLLTRTDRQRHCQLRL